MLKSRPDSGLLNLRCMNRPVIDPSLRERESLLSADMAVNTHEEIKQLFLEISGQGGYVFPDPKDRRRSGAGAAFGRRYPDGNLS